MIEGLLMGKSRVKVSYTRIAAIAGVARPVASKAINRLVDLGYVVDDEGAWKIDIDLLHRRAADVRSDLFPSAA
jgi:DNA-binding IclR family transcriptional regulator